MLSKVTGFGFNWLHSYGNEDPDQEDLDILSDDTINVKAKRAIQNKTQRIRALEELVVKLTEEKTNSLGSHYGFEFPSKKKKIPK